MKKIVLVPMACLLLAGSAALAQGPAYLPPPSPPKQAAPESPPRAYISWGGPVTDTAPPMVLVADSGPSTPVRIWGSADFLLWWIRQGRVPPLVTASGPGAGAILGPDTAVLFGGSRLDSQLQSGGRFLFGGWLDPAGTVGLEASYLFLGSSWVNFQASSGGGPGTLALGRPFFDVVGNAENSQLVAFPGQLAGRVVATASTRMQGGEGNGIFNLWRTPNAQVGALFGFRYLQLNEGLGIGEDLSVLPLVPITAGTDYRVLDQFDTTNRFYGGQVGIRGETRLGRWFVNGTAKLALGDTNQVVNINGSTLIVPPAGSPLVGGLHQGGLLALPSNIGLYHNDAFTVLPEVNLNVGYWISRSCRLTAGYTFLYWSSVARPGDQINRMVNPTLLPLNQTTTTPSGPTQPTFACHDTDFWAQGLNLGVEFWY